MKKSWTLKFIDDVNDILNYLPIGINIPILQEFKEFILHDLNAFPSRSLLLYENQKIIAHTLLFHDDGDTLYFGFFGGNDLPQETIEYMIQQLKEYARTHNFQYIRGPINIPTIIYGWGFMGKDSIDTLYRAKPVTPLLYLNVFLKNSFYINTEEVTWEGDISKVDLNRYDVGEEVRKHFEIIDLHSWDDFERYSSIVLQLNRDNMPSESILTPSLGRVVINYMNFFRRFGDLFMVTFVQDKTARKIIGYISCLPNPFDNKAFCIFTLVIDKEYRSKRLGWFLAKRTFEKLRAHGLNYMSAPIEKTNTITQLMCESLGLHLLRRHFIVECKL